MPCRCSGFLARARRYRCGSCRTKCRRWRGCAETRSGDFSCGCQANVYFTPPRAQGFKTHHDTHDVFILQLLGSKRWRTYPIRRVAAVAGTALCLENAAIRSAA